MLFGFIWVIFSYVSIITTSCTVNCALFNVPPSLSPAKQLRKPKVLVLSIGGFRSDYLTKARCPTLERFIANGVTTKYVQNSMNTASLVNHVSIATGLYPESHGVVSNMMFDPLKKRVFDSKTRNDPNWWDNVHPVWKELETQGKGRSGVCRWPGVYGPLVLRLNCQGERRSFKHDIDHVLEWFLKEDVDLAFLYTDDIKKKAVKWGPHSIHAMEEIKILDFLMNYLLQKIYDFGLEVNVLVTTDHGVTDLQWRNVIDLDKCIDPASYILLNSQGTLLIYPKHGHTSKDVYTKLKRCPELNVYLKEHIPLFYHFSKHRRVPPIIAFVPLGAIVRSSKKIHKKINEVLKGSHGISRDMGGGGYDPGYEVMTSVFFANGPSFRKGLQFRAIRNTDIYNMICYLLQLHPRANNGSLNVVRSMLTESALSVVSKPSAPSTSEVVVSGRPTGERVVNDVLDDPDIRGLFWFLVAGTIALFLFCCIGCAVTMRQNAKRYSRKTSVHPPGAKRLLSTYSSDEE